MSKHVVILGGGLAGLACAYEAARAGEQVTVLEREPQVGGMAASFEEGDRTTAGEPGSDYFSYDFGPHRLHSDDPGLMRHVEDLLGENRVWNQRLSRIHLFDRFFDYPLDAGNVLKNFPPLMLARALLDYAWIRVLDASGLRRFDDANFREWVVRRFGNTLARIFFVEYTEKTWGTPATEISSAWASQRITLLSLGDAIWKTLFRPRTPPRTLVTDFIYPEVGGIGEIARAYTRRIRELGGRVLVDAPVVRVHRDGSRIARVEYRHEGESCQVEADEYISTIPVTALARCVTPAPPEPVREAIRSLRYIAIVFVYLKVARPQLTPDNWVYLPQKSLSIHRISEFKNFSPRAGPPDQTLICAEITCPAGGEIWRASTDELRAIAAGDLATIGLLQEDEILGCHVRRIPFAYPLYDLEYEGHLQHVMGFVHGLENIRTGGRQGLFRYNNMDQSIEMGRRMGHALTGTGGATDHEAVATEQRYFG